jgi:hypothetical protein
MNNREEYKVSKKKQKLWSDKKWNEENYKFEDL